MNAAELDYLRLAQAVLVRACEDARAPKPSNLRAEARDWLTCEPNPLRDAILPATNLTDDDLRRYVQGLK
jgi:hypothetical protein